jgi:hypothetical protein
MTLSRLPLAAAAFAVSVIAAGAAFAQTTQQTTVTTTSPNGTVTQTGPAITVPGPAASTGTSAAPAGTTTGGAVVTTRLDSGRALPPGTVLEQLSPSDRAAINQRLGPKQRKAELVQTTLLNEMGDLGFAKLGKVEKTGETYQAQVQTTLGNWVTIDIDPATGIVRTTQ